MITEGRAKARREFAKLKARYVIDGEPYRTVAEVHRVVVMKGGAGCVVTTRYRILKGARTWDELLKPVSEHLAKSIRKVSAASKIARDASRNEAAAAMAAVAARRKEMVTK